MFRKCLKKEEKYSYIIFAHFLHSYNISLFCIMSFGKTHSPRLRLVKAVGLPTKGDQSRLRLRIMSKYVNREPRQELISPK